MRLELSRKAQADLDDIHDYSVDQHGRARAILYLDDIEQAFRRIMDFPQIGVSEADVTEALRSVPVNEHRIYYRAGSNTIMIMRVLHKAMDPARYL